MIKQVLGSPVAYPFYDIQFLVREEPPPPPGITQLPSGTLFITTIYTYLWKEVV